MTKRCETEVAHLMDPQSQRNEFLLLDPAISSVFSYPFADLAAVASGGWKIRDAGELFSVLRRSRTDQALEAADEPSHTREPDRRGYLFYGQETRLLMVFRLCQA